jgi:hypothetical protein
MDEGSLTVVFVGPKSGKRHQSRAKGMSGWLKSIFTGRKGSSPSSQDDAHAILSLKGVFRREVWSHSGTRTDCTENAMILQNSDSPGFSKLRSLHLDVSQSLSLQFASSRSHGQDVKLRL